MHNLRPKNKVIQGRLWRCGIKISLIVFGLMLGLLLAEVCVRVFFPHARDHVIPGGLFAIDDELGWTLVADKERRHRTRYFDVLYAMNAFGFRDIPRDLTKTERQYRILLYGDSQIFGWGVESEQRFSNRLEAQHSSLEILNLAVPGYGLDQQILAYEKNGHRFQPDEVIFFVSSGTLSRIPYTYIYRKHKPAFRLGPHKSLDLIPLPQKTAQWEQILYKALSPFYLPYFVERQLAKIQAASSAMPPGENTPRTEKYFAVNSLERAILDRVEQIARERNHRLTLLTNLPFQFVQMLKNDSAQQFIDVIPITFDIANHKLVFGPEDQHWNPRAHGLIAQQLHSHIASRLGVEKKLK